MDVARKVKEARIRNGLSQIELANRTGIDQTVISGIECGKRNPSVKILQRLADGMNADIRIEFVSKGDNIL
ncbi:MAG: helix-turn-helix transcriptional regulator [Catonella sp.]|nr:helix-turn-helix transcriptional regulator [Catonella sp.]MDY6356261.1 helix-turn-helix transcriptional regulator [Catonella sp.]